MPVLIISGLGKQLLIWKRIYFGTALAGIIFLAISLF
jgi:hypothetical protein